MYIRIHGLRIFFQGEQKGKVSTRDCCRAMKTGRIIALILWLLALTCRAREQSQRRDVKENQGRSSRRFWMPKAHSRSRQAGRREWGKKRFLFVSFLAETCNESWNTLLRMKVCTLNVSLWRIWTGVVIRYVMGVCTEHCLALGFHTIQSPRHHAGTYICRENTRQNFAAVKRLHTPPAIESNERRITNYITLCGTFNALRTVNMFGPTCLSLFSLGAKMLPHIKCEMMAR